MLCIRIRLAYVREASRALVSAAAVASLCCTVGVACAVGADDSGDDECSQFVDETLSD